MALANVIASGDPGSRLSSAAVDLGAGAGLSFPLTGTWGSADWAGDYPYFVWPLQDAFGVIVSGDGVKAATSAFSLGIRMRATVPVPTDEVRVAFAVVNETDLTTATIDGVGIGWLATGVVNPSCVHTDLANGVATDAVSGTGPITNVVGQVGSAGVTTFRASPAYGLSSTGVFSVGTAGGAGGSLGLGKLYLALAVGRSNVAAVNAFTVNVDAFVRPFLSSPLMDF